MLFLKIVKDCYRELYHIVGRRVSLHPLESGVLTFLIKWPENFRDYRAACECCYVSNYDVRVEILTSNKLPLLPVRLSSGACSKRGAAKGGMTGLCLPSLNTQSKDPNWQI